MIHRSYISDVLVGDCDNDGSNELLVITRYSGFVLFYDHFDNGWIETKLVERTESFTSAAIGDVKNIGQNLVVVSKKIEPLTMSATCPVDLKVIDPEGLTINKQSREITGVKYIETDLNGDDELDDQVIIPDRKIGDYYITVIPEPEAEPTDTYSLEVSVGDITLVLAEDVPINSIPDQPYCIESTENCISDVTLDKPNT
ncbi:MAG: hypothetical protein HXS48_16860 [Theionarchaea archaeon]|nr:MAG: hypothetical protein AYK19_00015 [Theionarchaea archaeon DG-70-1]MBU7028608.1 hypothetical protein [Theionarchaea archaeon]